MSSRWYAICNKCGGVREDVGAVGCYDCASERGGCKAGHFACSSWSKAEAAAQGWEPSYCDAHEPCSCVENYPTYAALAHAWRHDARAWCGPQRLTAKLYVYTPSVNGRRWGSPETTIAVEGTRAECLRVEAALKAAFGSAYHRSGIEHVTHDSDVLSQERFKAFRDIEAEIAHAEGEAVLAEVWTERLDAERAEA